MVSPIVRDSKFRPFRRFRRISAFGFVLMKSLQLNARVATLKVCSAVLLSFGLVNASQAQTQTTTFRVTIFNPNPADTKASVDGLEAAIATRGRVSKRVGLLPSPLPDAMGQPTYKTFNFGPFTQRMLDCGGAYAEVSIASDTGANPLGGSGERFFGCLYLSKFGIRTSLVIERYVRSSGPIGGAIVGFLRKTVEGDDATWGKKIIDQMTAEVRNKVPGALIDQVEMPGGEVSRPDGDKVDTLLASANAAPVAALTPIDISTAGLQQAMPVKTSVATTSATQAVEARKQLSSMGLTYHSLPQFHDAIRRKDEIAVELFVTSRGVSSTAAGPDGVTAKTLAAQIGDEVLSQLVAQLDRPAGKP